MQVGEIIDGKYRVGRLLGQGGMGAVYEGFHTLIERRVAIKVLSQEVSSSREGMSRFAREARAAGRIGNDHILDIYDVGALPDGRQYMVSEYLEGETLAGRLEHTGTLAPREICGLLLQLLSGLAAAHQAGIVHRDLKPDNVFLLRDGRRPLDFVKIIDFGISKFDVGDDSGMSMTRTGTVLGTPYYLSPEQARGMAVDGRSDIYSVGVILYEAVTSRVPFSASNFHELLFKIALEQPTPPEEHVPGLEPAIGELIRKAMARAPEERFQSALEMQAAINAWLSLSVSGDGRRNSSPPLRSDRVAAWSPTASNFGGTAADGILAPQLARRRRRLAVGGGVAVAALGLVGALLLHRTQVDTVAAAAAVPAPPTSAASTPVASPLPSPALPDVPPPEPRDPIAEPAGAAELGPNQPAPDHTYPPPSARTPGDASHSTHPKRPLASKAVAPGAQPTITPQGAALPANTAPSKLDRDFGY